MKAKKIIITLAAAVCLGVAVYAIHGNLANDKPEQHATEETSLDNGMKDHLFGKNLFLDAKMDGYDSLADLEKDTDLVVIAKKIAQDDPTIIYGQEDRIDIAYTLSHFKVSKVINGNQLNPGDEFTMLENQAYDKKQGLTYHIGGYQMIKKDRDYLLLLRKSETDPWYIVAGVNPGKVDLSSDQTDYPDSVKNADTQQARMIKSAYFNDEKIREEAKQKYASYID
ncbi:hypothetical protein ACFC67_04375 [Enterococcus gallinarum]|uniref:hypothetical protein n=1 Tax=Enterococcus gallinarum TaxID=1353 RepID=UPI0035E3168A|nr:hypothetical protein [Enterococcus gallinarum]